MYSVRVSASHQLAEDLLAAVAAVNRWATAHATLPASQSQARLLAQIEGIAPVRVGELARAERCSQPTMTVALQRLERHGWVVRQTDPEDSRASLIALSDAGSATLRAVRAARADAVAPALDALSPEFRLRLADAVEALRALPASAAGSTEKGA